LAGYAIFALLDDGGVIKEKAMDGQVRETGSPGWSLSLVIPAYNEEAGICQAIEEAAAALAQLADRFEIIVVDDGSTDDTARIVSHAAEGLPQVRLLRHPENRGYSAALRTGFEAARYERVAFTDADCQFDLTDLARLLPHTDQYPAVVGYRVDRQDPWRRRFLSRGYNLLARFLLGTRVRDCDCALKVFRKEALSNLLPETEGFFVNTEMLARARQLDYGVAEVGVRHRPRLRGSSKVSLRDIPRTLATFLPFWWTQVAFPSPSSPSPLGGEGGCEGLKVLQLSPPRPYPRNLQFSLGGRGVNKFFAIFLLLLAAGLLFFGRLRSPLLEPEEAVYAEVPREMAAAGNLITPLRRGRAYYEKPPLFYWLTMASYSSFGVHDWAARLIPCAAALGTILVTFWWGTRNFGFRAGLVGALILCLSPRFVHQARMITMDGLLCFWVVTALALGQRAIESPQRKQGQGLRQWNWWLLSAVACGFGVLTKGPVALALVAAPLLTYQLLDSRTIRPKTRWWLAYLGTALGLALPWYLILAWRDPTFLRDFFWTHHVVMRFLQPLHEEPAWFYFPVLLLGMLPWTLLLPAVIRLLTRPSRAMGQKRPAEMGFLLLGCLWCILFFSAASCKRIGYILPAMPLLALILGYTLDRVLATRRGIETYYLRTSILPSRFSISPWIAFGVSTFAVLFLAVHFLLPGYYRKFSMRSQVQTLLDDSYHPQAPVVCYPHIWDSVCFYLGRTDVRAFSAERREDLIADLGSRSQTLMIVKSNHWLRDLKQALPAELEFLPRGRQGNVTAGVVQHRQDPPKNSVASR
jgi:dolichol-phosphate mannosyltransferase